MGIKVDKDCASSETFTIWVEEYTMSSPPPKAAIARGKASAGGALPGVPPLNSLSRAVSSSSSADDGSRAGMEHLIPVVNKLQEASPS